MNKTSYRFRSACRRVLTALLVMTAVTAFADPAQEMAQGVKAYADGDVVAATQHFRRAAKQGHAPAQVRLGQILDAAERNEESVRWYRAAAEQGLADGQFAYAGALAAGEGVTKDHLAARDWVTRAAEQGHSGAIKMLSTAYEKGQLGLDPDTAQAVVWLERAAEKGEVWAMRRLVAIYREGRPGVPAQPAIADRWQARITAR